MDINKKIVKALLEKNYVDVKESVYKSLYAKASLLLDEERVGVAEALFNEESETDEDTVEEDVSQETEAAEQLDEVSPPGMEKMTGSKKTKASFAKQYGKRGKEVMYATAWKQYNKNKA